MSEYCSISIKSSAQKDEQPSSPKNCRGSTLTLFYSVKPTLRWGKAWRSRLRIHIHLERKTRWWKRNSWCMFRNQDQYLPGLSDDTNCHQWAAHDNSLNTPLQQLYHSGLGLRSNSWCWRHKEPILPQLTDVILRIPTQEKLLILGDLNMRVGKNHRLWKIIIGKEGVCNCNAKGLIP